MSPTPASGSLLRWAPKPKGSMMKRDLAPLLSAQLRTAPTGRPRVRRYFVPEAAPPIVVHIEVQMIDQSGHVDQFKVVENGANEDEQAVRKARE